MSAANGTNNEGHGHVFKRPDGHRMRCGGPRMCKDCALDAARKNATPTADSVRNEFNAALDFALDEQRGDLASADAFLRLWREGSWHQIEIDWPEWKTFRRIRNMPERPGSGLEPN